MKLALGTAQFGLEYGVSNLAGRTPFDEVERILARAVQAGVRTIDTAPAYGDAERVIGRVLAGNGPFRIVTKTPAGIVDADAVRASLDASLAALGVGRVYGLLAHSSADLLGPDGDAIFDAMCSARDDGLVERIGVSVYSPSQADEAARRFGVTLVQLPVNLVDQRFVRSGTIARLAASGVEVHARSPFLQGALLMSAEELPSYLGGLRAALERIDDLAASLAVSRQALALGYVSQLDGVTHVVAGVSDATQFEELIAAASSEIPAGLEFGDLAIDDEHIIDPSTWPLKGSC